MRLTRYTDYAMRVLLYLGTRPDKICPIAEIARTYGISQNHLMKVVNDLSNAGYVTSVRGRAGGLLLGRSAEAINIGEVVRHTEEGFDLVDCPSCFIAPACGLNVALGEALAAFLAVLDGYTLADLIAKRDGIGTLFELRREAQMSFKPGGPSP
jgi:Rrf2 family nitric oxide-sensitive transcriptional repressor